MTAPREYDTVTYYMGRPVSEMSRVELIAAINELGHQLQFERENHKATIDFRDIAAARRLSQ